MTRYADPHRCPDCRRLLAPEGPVCRGCGLDLTGSLGAELFSVLTRADELLGELRDRSRPRSSPGPVLDGPLAAPVAAAPEGRTVGALPGLGAASVPKILLGLGALCLLVAGVVFLAVTWSVLTVAGRTGVLVAGTAAAATVTGWLARRGLRVAAEALSTVTFGLVVLDLAGARTAGWLGAPSLAALQVVTGVLLVVGGCGAARVLRRTPSGAGLAAELAAALGAFALVLGVGSLEVATQPVRLVASTLLAAGVATLAGRRLAVARGGGAAAAVLSWLALLLSGLAALGPAPTVRSAWGAADAWPLLAAAALATGLVLVRTLDRSWRVAALAAGLVPTALALTAPALDEPPSAVAGVTVAVLLGSALLMAWSPRPWAVAGVSVAGPAAAYALTRALALLEDAAERYAEVVHPVWGGLADDRLGVHSAPALPAAWLLPALVAALGAAAWSAGRACDLPRRLAGNPRGSALRLASGYAAVASAALAVTGTLLLHPVPVWSVPVVLLAGAAAATVDALRATGAAVPGGAGGSRAAGSVALAATAGAAAIGAGLHAPWLTAGALTGVLVLALATHCGARVGAVAAAGGATLGTLLAGLTWTLGELAGVDGRWTSLVALLLLATLAVGRPVVPLGRRTGEVLLAVEGGAAVAALPVAVAGVQAATLAGSVATWTSVYLTVAGAAAGALALSRADRRPVGWLGGLLLLVASWVRLADVGVAAPEPYALPGATVLLVLGVRWLRHHPEGSTLRALGPGLVLGVLPSLTWAWAEPLGVRALVLGAACLLLVGVGLRLRWTAPLVVGAVVGTVLVLREAAPYLGAAVPRWALIGAAGILLTTLGVTWEQRVNQVQGMAQRLRGFR